MPYKESKLTRSIQNCLTTQTSVMLIANLNSDERFYDECLSTLQFVEKTRSLDMRGKFVSVTTQDESPSKGVERSDKYVKRLKEELSEARSCIDSTIKVKKYDKISKKLYPILYLNESKKISDPFLSLLRKLNKN